MGRSCRMATQSQKISHFHGIQDIKTLLGQLQWKHRTVLWQKVMSAILNENHNTSAHPLKQTHSATGQAESRPLTLQDRGTSWWGVSVLEENIFTDRWLQCWEVHWLYSTCDNPKQHIHESVSISHLKDTICSVSGTVTAESTKLLTGLKSKCVSKIFSNIIQQIHFLLSTELLAMPHSAHIQKTKFTISIKCF